MTPTCVSTRVAVPDQYLPRIQGGLPVDSGFLSSVKGRQATTKSGPCPQACRPVEEFVEESGVSPSPVPDIQDVTRRTLQPCFSPGSIVGGVITVWDAAQCTKLSMKAGALSIHSREILKICWHCLRPTQYHCPARDAGQHWKTCHPCTEIATRTLNQHLPMAYQVPLVHPFNFVPTPASQALVTPTATLCPLRRS